MEDPATWGKQTFIQANEGRIAANLHYPKSPANRADWVIMCHGLGGNRHEHNGIFTRTAASFASSNIGAVRFDFRGNGESDFESEFMNLVSMKEDIYSVIDYVKESSGQEGECKIHLLGLSLGGLLAGLVTSELEDIESVILWEPPFHLIKTLKRLLGPMQFDRVRVRGYVQSGLLKLSSEFVEQFDNLDVTKLNDLDRCPVLLVQGEADQIVTMDDAKLWSDLYSGNKAFSSIFLSGADHAFTREEDAMKVIDQSVSWLKTSRM